MARVLLTCFLIVLPAHLVSISHIFECKPLLWQVLSQRANMSPVLYFHRRNHPVCLSWKCTLLQAQAVCVNGPATARSFSVFAWSTHKTSYYQSRRALTALEWQEYSAQTPSPAVRISACLLISSGRWVGQLKTPSPTIHYQFIYM